MREVLEARLLVLTEELVENLTMGPDQRLPEPEVAVLPRPVPGIRSAVESVVKVEEIHRSEPVLHQTTAQSAEEAAVEVQLTLAEPVTKEAAVEAEVLMVVVPEEDPEVVMPVQ